MRDEERQKLEEGAWVRTQAATPQPSPDSDAPVLPAEYEFLAKLGEGGMGVVYKARNLYTNRTVAIKMLKSGASQIAMQRFQREAQATCAFTHPNVVQALAFDVIDETAYLVMEYVEGETLSERLTKRGSLTEQETMAIFRNVCAGLASAHANGIVHRDLKPSNIVLTRFDGRETARVLDFGIAKMVDTDSQAKLTQTGEVFGTPLYMSPEQLKGEKIEPASDVYSVGAVMYHCLAGEPPHEGDSAYAIMFKRLGEKPLSFEKHDKQISGDVESIVMKCLELDPKKRYSNAGELVGQIDRYRKSNAFTRTINTLKRRIVSASHASGVLTVIALFVIAASVYAIVGSNANRFRTKAAKPLVEARLLREQADRTNGAALMNSDDAAAQATHESAIEQYLEALPLYDKALSDLKNDAQGNGLEKEIFRETRECLQGIVPNIGEEMAPQGRERFLWTADKDYAGKGYEAVSYDIRNFLPKMRSAGKEQNDPGLLWDSELWTRRELDLLIDGYAKHASERAFELDPVQDQAKVRALYRVVCECYYAAMKNISGDELRALGARPVAQRGSLQEYMFDRARSFAPKYLQAILQLAKVKDPNVTRYFLEIQRVNQIAPAPELADILPAVQRALNSSTEYDIESVIGAVRKINPSSTSVPVPAAPASAPAADGTTNLMRDELR
jgi:serine/threonine protein kinase